MSLYHLREKLSNTPICLFPGLHGCEFDAEQNVWQEPLKGNRTRSSQSALTPLDSLCFGIALERNPHARLCVLEKKGGETGRIILRLIIFQDRNLLQMSRSIWESAIVCQGETWHIMLGTRGFRWTGLFRAGIVRCERKGERARDLQIGDV
jgi:hypothetical protein